MERKLDKIIALMGKDNWVEAISAAAKFPRLGRHKSDIMKANEAIKRPAFQVQLGNDPALLIQRGKEALLERYKNAK